MGFFFYIGLYDIHPKWDAICFIEFIECFSTLWGFCWSAPVLLKGVNLYFINSYTNNNINNNLFFNAFHFSNHFCMWDFIFIISNFRSNCCYLILEKITLRKNFFTPLKLFSFGAYGLLLKKKKNEKSCRLYPTLNL